MNTEALMAQEPLMAEVDYTTQSAVRQAFDFYNGSKTTLEVASVPMPVTNARALPDPPTIEREGIQVVPHKTAIAMEDDLEDIRNTYFAEMTAFLKQFTGADFVIPQGKRGLILRRPPIDNRPHYLQMKGTRIAHLDFTENSFDKWASSALRHAELDDPRPCKRIMCMQTWRMMAPPPQNEMLALCDARTYSREDGVVFDSIISPDDKDTFETVVLKPNPKHRWLFWPDLTRDEVILFKGWDTDRRYPVDVPHQAISNPLAGSSPNLRQSIEARFYCFFR